VLISVIRYLAYCLFVGYFVTCNSVVALVLVISVFCCLSYIWFAYVTVFVLLLEF